MLISFGWKILVSSLIDVLYQDLRSMVIGYKYDDKTLGFYSNGKKFPQFLINGINGAVQSVMRRGFAYDAVRAAAEQYKEELTWDD